MPDVYANIGGVDPALQARLAELIELRAADPRQRAMLHAYLVDIEFPPEATVLEIGCATGAVTRTLARWPSVARAIGIDPSEVFIARARELGSDIPNLSFERGDGRALRFDSGSIQVIVLHTTLCHVPEPERLLGEARRVLQPGGWLAVFDGDYATTTVALTEHDPLQACVRAFIDNYVHDPWLVRRLPRLLEGVGFTVAPTRSHGYLESPEAGYMLAIIDRGADALAQSGAISGDAAAALKSEARRRSADKTWFGHIAFASVLARAAPGGP